MSGLGARESINGSKAVIEVPPSVVMYAQFQHVTGVAAADGVSGASLVKLRLLDSLIEQLQRMKQDSVNLNMLEPAAGAESRLDVLIGQLKQRLETGMADAAGAPYQSVGGFSEGSFVSVSA
jgi:hypothetical protein